AGHEFRRAGPRNGRTRRTATLARSPNPAPARTAPPGSTVRRRVPAPRHPCVKLLAIPNRPAPETGAGTVERCSPCGDRRAGCLAAAGGDVERLRVYQPPPPDAAGGG